MTTYIIDAYAWIEYALGSKKGMVVRDIVENQEHRIYTNIVTFSELAAYCARHNKSFEELKRVILSLSIVYPIDVTFCEDAGNAYIQIRKERKHMGMIDVFVLLSARKLKGKVVTGDQDFKGLLDVVLLK